MKKIANDQFAVSLEVYVKDLMHG